MLQLRTLLLAFGFWALSVSLAAVRADTWLLVETNIVPSGCATASDCVERSIDQRRDLMAMDADETMAFLGVIGDLARLKNVPDVLDGPDVSELPLDTIIPQLQVLEVQDKVGALRGLPGVYFDASRVSGDGAGEAFTAYFTDLLTNNGIPVLTEEEALALPGAGRLSVSLSLTRDNAGCILPFRANISLKEEVVLVRDPSIKLELTTWSGSVNQNFTNTNYLAGAALRDVAKKFVADYQTANADNG